MDAIQKVRSALIDPRKIQLHTGLEGFDSPKSFGIYRNTGGKPLGVVGDVYEPPNLHILLDTIIQSVETCGTGFLDLDKTEYHEYKGGQKVSISIPTKGFEVSSSMVGDVFAYRLDFFTGFDGLTKYSLSGMALRLWCANGAKRWDKDISLSFKNTKGNQGKLALFCEEITRAIQDVESYKNWLNRATTIKFTQADLDKFFTKLLGYSQKEYTELTTRKRNILDKINASVAIEEANTQATLFSLLQGITRYTSHELVDNLDGLMVDLPAKLNKDAHVLVDEMMN